jgi:Mrp family chromosome partitioning ATPase
MLSVADATILATRVDGVLMVVDAGFTRRGVAKRAKEALQAIGANVVGVVVNRAAVKSESDYYYDYSYASDGKEKKRSGKSRTQAGTATSSALKPVKLTKPATGEAVAASNGAVNGATTERAK